MYSTFNFYHRHMIANCTSVSTYLENFVALVTCHCLYQCCQIHQVHWLALCPCKKCNFLRIFRNINFFLARHGDSKSNMPAQPLIGCDIFFASHQICDKCTSRGPEEVLFVFGVIRNPRWLPFPPIGGKHFLLLFQKNCMLCHQAFQTVPFGDPMPFYNGENLISAVLSHKINYKFIYIHINYLMGIFLEFNLSYEQREITLILLRLKLEQRR